MRLKLVSVAGVVLLLVNCSQGSSDSGSAGGSGGLGGNGAGGATGSGLGPGEGGAGGSTSSLGGGGAASGSGASGGFGGGGASAFGGGGASGTGGTEGTGGSGGTEGTGGSGGTEGTGGAGGGGASAQGGGGAGTGGNGPCATHLLISEIKTRGVDGGADEFVEIFNPTDDPVTLDDSWSVQALSVDVSSTTYSVVWKGSGAGTIPAHGFFLVGGQFWGDSPEADEDLILGVSDAASVHLVHAGNIVDAVCFRYKGTQSFGAAKYTCEGTPADNAPHNNGGTAASNVDQSLVRQSGAGVAKCADTGDSATDFVKANPSTPTNSQGD